MTTVSCTVKISVVTLHDSKKKEIKSSKRPWYGFIYILSNFRLKTSIRAPFHCRLISNNREKKANGGKATTENPLLTPMYISFLLSFKQLFFNLEKKSNSCSSVSVPSVVRACVMSQNERSELPKWNNTNSNTSKWQREKKEWFERTTTPIGWCIIWMAQFSIHEIRLEKEKKTQSFYAKSRKC